MYLGSSLVQPPRNGPAWPATCSHTLFYLRPQGRRKATCCFLNPNLNFISHNPFKFKWAMQKRRKAGSRYGSIWCCLAGSSGRVCLSQCDANHIIYIMINLVLTTPTSEATTSHQNCSMADLGEADCTLLGLHISSASIGLRQLRDVVTAILLSFTLGEINVSVEQEKNQTWPVCPYYELGVVHKNQEWHMSSQAYYLSQAKRKGWGMQKWAWIEQNRNKRIKTFEE